MLWNTPPNPAAAPLLLLAHGAGAPMDSNFMQRLAEALCAQGVEVARFEFAYMAARREGAKRRPPPRMPTLVAEFQAELARVQQRFPDRPLFVAGKSMGARVAAELAADHAVAGVLAFGYPFHPPGKLDKLRLAPFARLTQPCLIVQGENDPFGKYQEVQGYALPDQVRVIWVTKANHDLKTAARTGMSWDAAIDQAARQAAEFMLSVG